jgi:aspartyl-tRNA(Asn)/glutamyl-tRNA(Gln) amidotransferase subunit B
MAKGVFEEMFDSGKPASQIVKEKGLSQITDVDQIGGVVTEVLDSNPEAVADFSRGKEQALTFLVGQVMKVTRGRANPAMVNKLLKEQLQAKK